MASEVEIVYNACYGGYDLSEEALKLYNEKRTVAGLLEEKYPLRTDPLLVEVVKELGKAANGKHSNLQIKSIPAEYKDCYTIDEYDGQESVFCDSAKLIEYKLFLLANEHGSNLDNMTDAECKEFLLSLIKINRENGIK